ncbi:hypothetical protein GCM10009791_12850 [Citricoccus zhacaiensis]
MAAKETAVRVAPTINRALSQSEVSVVDGAAVVGEPWTRASGETMGRTDMAASLRRVRAEALLRGGRGRIPGVRGYPEGVTDFPFRPVRAAAQWGRAARTTNVRGQDHPASRQRSQGSGVCRTTRVRGHRSGPGR